MTYIIAYNVISISLMNNLIIFKFFSVGKRQASTPSSTSTKTTMSYTGAIMTSGRSSSSATLSINNSGGKQTISSVPQTFAAKLTENSPPQPLPPQVGLQQPTSATPTITVDTETVGRPP